MEDLNQNSFTMLMLINELNFQFNFNLYVEVKKNPVGSSLDEFNDGKQMWLKVTDMTNEIYQQYYKPTVYNNDIKILTTKPYVPPYPIAHDFQATSDYFSILF